MNWLKTAFIISLIIFFLFGCTLPFGNKEFESTTEDSELIHEEQVMDLDKEISLEEKEVELDVEVDEDKDELTITSSTNGNGGSIKIGENLPVPESLPNDIPFPEDFTIYQSYELEGYIQLFYYTSEDPETVTKMYVDFLDENIIGEIVSSSYDQDGDIFNSFAGKIEKGGIAIIVANDFSGVEVSDDAKSNVSIVFDSSE